MGRVPLAQITPADTFLLYFHFNMRGRLSIPIVTTVAPTIPVDAAIKTPTNKTEYTRPPRIFPQSLDMFSRSELAIPDFSNITPIKINRGTAIKVSLVIIPKTLFGKTLRRTNGDRSTKKPKIATKIAVP